MLFDRHLLARVALAASLAVGASACASDPTPTADSLHGMVPSGAEQRVDDLGLPDVTTNAASANFAFKAQAGHVLALYFGYTNCPDICPTAMADLSSAIKKLPTADRDRIDVAFSTVDLTRDTPEVLNDWMQHFFPTADNVHVLRPTSKEQLATTLEQLGLESAVQRKPDGTIEVGHSAVMMFIDAKGVVRLGWPDGVAKADMPDDLRTLLALYGA